MATASASVNLTTVKSSGSMQTKPTPSGTPDVQVIINTAKAMTAGQLRQACADCILQLSGYLK